MPSGMLRGWLAIDAGLAGHRPLMDALAEYEQQRNTAVQAMYAFICQLTARPMLAPPIDP